MGKMTGAQYIARTLQGYGVTHVFYIEAILRRSLVEMEKLGINRILAHCEKAAAYMADGFARVGNRPGVCMAQSVGAANLAAGLQDAYLGYSPVIAFTGRKPPLCQYRNAYQEIDHNRMYDPVTKYNAELDTLDQLPYILPQAFREVSTGIPKPVHVDFLGYEGSFTDTAEADLEVVIEERYSSVPARKSAPEDRDIHEAVAALMKAEKPVIVIDRGAVLAGAAGAIQAFAEAHSIPIVFSVDGKGAVPDTHPLVVGPVGTYNKPCANKVTGESDCVLFIGSTTSDQVTNNWTLPVLGTPVIQIDVDPSECGRSYPGAVGVCGDPEVSVSMLADAMKGKKSYDDWAAYARTCVESWKAGVADFKASDAQPIRPERLCTELTAALPEDAVVVADTGYSAIWAATMIDITSPKQSFIRAAGSLGWAFPASLGAKCAVGDRPVVCFSGDGALWYHFSELETAKRWGINTVTVVNNNSVLGQCLKGINRAYQDDTGQKNHMSNFVPTNFAELAREIGCYGVRVTDPAQIQPEIQKALAQDLPAVIDVVTVPGAHPILE